MTATDAPTPDDLAEIRARHVPWRDHRHAVCAECAHTWPCDAARLLALLDRETAHWRAAEADLARCGAELRGFSDEADRAEAERDRARFWAAGWRRAAYDFRDRADLAFDALEQLERQQAGLCDRLDLAAAVVAAARRAVAGADYRFPLADLRDALAALDAATQQG